MANVKQELLRKLPSIADLLATDTAAGWLAEHPRPLVTDCLRETVDELRRQILADAGGRCGAMHVTAEYILPLAAERLADRTRPHLRGAINVGAGLRARAPGVDGWLRVDWGLDPASGASRLSAAWVQGPPR